MSVVNKRDIGNLDRNIAEVRVRLRLTLPMAKMLLERCPSLGRVILTNTSRSLTPPHVVKLLDDRKIAVDVDLRTQGRPAELSLSQAEHINALRGRGWSYRELGRKFGVSHTEIANVCHGRVQFKRRRDEYANSRVPGFAAPSRTNASAPPPSGAPCSGRSAVGTN